MTVLVILAAFYLAVLLVQRYTPANERQKAVQTLLVNALVLAGLVLAVLAGFGVVVIPALTR